EVVEARVGIAAAGRLDPGRDEVVVLVAGLVVAQGAALQGVLGDRERDAAARRGQLQRRQRGPRVAAGALGQERDRVVVDLRATDLAALQRAAHQRLDLRG